MLSVINLKKVYKPKKGVPVTAVDNVNLELGDKGMIFLLGKSGSGKSTMLNLLGGLDSYDGGEIIINGVSSKNFKQSHFDSYRNTYVGFIFQEYNVLEEFSVGANIGIALELQGKKATEEEINRILKQVDLDGFGNRKPNELSGGQKQRIAIARALVKNPQIIMADEPTGALDSVTGKSILNTLKKLSAEKLVIIVSHDRDFAEAYADRIIELSDGRVISDMTRDAEAVIQETGLSYNGKTVSVPAGYRLTEQDRADINEYLEKLKTGAVISLEENAGTTQFVQTSGKSDSNTGKNREFKLIKSRLPMKNAFTMGASSLKHKKFRLVMTVLLSCIAFGLFGLSDTFAAYNHIQTCTNSIYDSDIDYASLVKNFKVGTEDRPYWMNAKLSDKDIARISANTGVNFDGVFLPRFSNLSMTANLNEEKLKTDSQFGIYMSDFNGYAVINDKIIKDSDYQMVAGRLPEGGKNEIVISKYAYDVLAKAGYTDGTMKKNAKGEDVPVYMDIKNYDDILGKKLTFGTEEKTVVGILDTKLDMKRYERLNEEKKSQTNAEQLVDFALYQEFCSIQGYSLCGMVMINQSDMDALTAKEPKIYDSSKGNASFYADGFSINTNSLATLDDLSIPDIVWLNGKKTLLSEKEIIVHASSLYLEDESAVPLNADGTINYTQAIKPGVSFTLNGIYYKDDEGFSEEGYTVVGVIPDTPANAAYSELCIMSEKTFSRFAEKQDGVYGSALGSMPQSKEEIKNLVSYCYTEKDGEQYPLQNSVTFELDSIHELLLEFSHLFLYVGLGFALFAAIMFANFIATSISYKKQEIGILRAIGSRGNDVFRIFFAESFIIAIANFILSATGVAVATALINHFIRNQKGFLVTILSYGPRQILLLLAVSLLVAFLASFLPVKRIASKKPIDAIRNR